MKQLYIPMQFRKEKLELIHFIDGLIGSYVSQGYKLSVRQLYYQLVARSIIPNTEASYKRTAELLNNARLAGLIDWDAIEDRGRDIEQRSRWDSGASIVTAAARSFHMDMWANQERRVFAVVEKAALAGVLGRVCRDKDVPLLAARGYPSVSILRELALGYMLPAMQEGQEVVLLHFGDHDPSGIDMTRDLEERLQLFLRGNLVTLRRMALNMDQIEELSPPPNPAKATDSRFASYREEYGDESWELDALEPQYIASLLHRTINTYIDPDAWTARSQEIEDIRAKLQETADNFEE